MNTASSEIKSTPGDAETTPVTPGRDGSHTVGDLSAATSTASSQREPSFLSVGSVFFLLLIRSRESIAELYVHSAENPNIILK